MDYRVRFIADDLMPTGRLWVICEDVGNDATTLYLSESTTRLTCEEKVAVLEAAWAGANAVKATHAVPVQRERVSGP